MQDLQEWKVKSPEKFLVSMSPFIADKFRQHCSLHGFKYSKVIESLVIDFLISQGVAADRNALLVEEQMSK